MVSRVKLCICVLNFHIAICSVCRNLGFCCSSFLVSQSLLICNFSHSYINLILINSSGMGRLASVPSLTIDIINNPHHLLLCSFFDKRIRNFKNILARIDNDPLSSNCFFLIIVNNLMTVQQSSMPDIIGEVDDVILKQKGFQSHFHIYIYSRAQRYMHSVVWPAFRLSCMCTHLIWSGLLGMMYRMWGTSYQVLQNFSRFLLTLVSIQCWMCLLYSLGADN